MGSFYSILILVAMLGVMYFLMIRPQKKREKETNAMRAGVQVGDEIITIGGFCAKVVKTKEETLIIQVGPDKTKLEVMRWSVSKIVKESARHSRPAFDDEEEGENVSRRSKPRRIKKAAVEEVEETVEAPVTEEAVEAPEEVAEPAEEVVEESK